MVQFVKIKKDRKSSLSILYLQAPISDYFLKFLRACFVAVDVTCSLSLTFCSSGTERWGGVGIFKYILSPSMLLTIGNLLGFMMAISISRSTRKPVGTDLIFLINWSTVTYGIPLAAIGVSISRMIPVRESASKSSVSDADSPPLLTFFEWLPERLQPHPQRQSHMLQQHA